MIHCHKKSRLINSNGLNSSVKIRLGSLANAIAQYCQHYCVCCRGCSAWNLRWVLGVYSHIRARVLCPSGAGLPLAAGGAIQMLSKGPPSPCWCGLRCAEEGWSLSVLFAVKRGLWDAFLVFFSFFFACSFFSVCFSQLQCAQRGKKVNQPRRLQQPFKHRGGSNTGFQMPGLLFHHHSTSWTANKETAIIFVSCQKKLSSWRDGGWGQNTGAERRTK